MLRLAITRVTKSSVCLGPPHFSTNGPASQETPLSQMNQDGWSSGSYCCITPPKLPDTGRRKEIQSKILEPQTQLTWEGTKGNSQRELSSSIFTITCPLTVIINPIFQGRDYRLKGPSHLQMAQLANED